MNRLSSPHVRAAFWREWTRARHHAALAYVVPAIPPLVAVTLFSDMMSPAVDVAGFPNATFQDYMAPGAVLLAGMMMAGFTAVGVAEDRRSGFDDRLRLLGTSRISVTVGRLGFEALRILPAIVGAYALAVWLGDDLGFVALDAAALIVIGCAWAMVYNTAFHFIADRTRNPHAPIAMQPMFAMLTFPSTFWYPRELMPDWGKTMTDWNPMSWLTDAARVFTTGEPGTGAVALGVAVIVMVGAGFGVALELAPRES